MNSGNSSREFDSISKDQYNHSDTEYEDDEDGDYDDSRSYDSEEDTDHELEIEAEGNLDDLTNKSIIFEYE